MGLRIRTNIASINAQVDLQDRPRQPILYHTTMVGIGWSRINGEIDPVVGCSRSWSKAQGNATQWARTTSPPGIYPV